MGPTPNSRGEGRGVDCVVVEITPNFSFAICVHDITTLTSSAFPRDGQNRKAEISVCEQRYAAMVVRVLGEERRKERVGGMTLEERH